MSDADAERTLGHKSREAWAGRSPLPCPTPFPLPPLGHNRKRRQRQMGPRLTELVGQNGPE